MSLIPLAPFSFFSQPLNNSTSQLPLSPVRFQRFRCQLSVVCFQFPLNSFFGYSFALRRAHPRLSLHNDQRSSAWLADRLTVAQKNWLTVRRDAICRGHEMGRLATGITAQPTTGNHKTCGQRRDRLSVDRDPRIGLDRCG